GIVGWFSSADDPYLESKKAHGFHNNPIIRLFRNLSGVRFHGRIHETVNSSLNSLGGVIMTDISIHHYGVLIRSPVKVGKYVDLLYSELSNPNSVDKFFILYQLASVFIGLKDYSKALELLNKSFSINPNYFPTVLSLGSVYLLL